MGRYEMMSRFRLLLIVAVIALVAAACSGSDSTDSSDTTAAAAATTAAGGSGDATHGEELYQGTCAACHGADATGIDGLGKDLHDNDFTNSLTDPELIAFLEVGRPASDPDNTTGVDMPPKGGNPSLTDQDLQDIVAYLRTLQ
jgi:mono/diheme cytochrome c family protein